MGLSSVIIGIIILLVIITLSTITYFIFRKRIGKKRTAVGAQDEEAMAVDKNNLMTPKPLYCSDTSSTLKNSSDFSFPTHDLKRQPSNTTATLSPSSPCPPLSIHEPKKANYVKEAQVKRDQEINHPKDDAASWTTTDDIVSGSYQPNKPPSAYSECVKTLPHPRSSFFADKMELDSDEANDLYQSYMLASASNQPQESFVSTAAATIQQKASNLRTSIYQSIRRKSMHNLSDTSPIQQFFESPSRRSSISSATKAFPLRSSLQLNGLPSPQSPGLPSLEGLTGKYNLQNRRKSVSAMIVRQQEDLKEESEEEISSNKVMIDTDPQKSYLESLPVTPVTPKTIVESTHNRDDGKDYYAAIINDINQYHDQYNDDKDNASVTSKSTRSSLSVEEEKKQPTAAADVAREIIRSGSRKSLTRSMIITDEAAQVMFATLSKQENLPSPPVANITKYHTKHQKKASEEKPLNNDPPGTISGRKGSRNPLMDGVETIGRTCMEKPKDFTSLQDLFSKPQTSEQNPEVNQSQPKSNNVEAIRKMLQSSCGSSTSSLASSLLSSQHSMGRSPMGSINPRLQNQHLISLSLRASQSPIAARARPSMPIGFMSDDSLEDGSEGPMPTVSFSSSTVKTMIPEEEATEEANKKKILSKPNNKVQPVKKKPQTTAGNIKPVKGKTPAQIEREKYLKSLKA